jgi:hypothetical protein
MTKEKQMSCGSRALAKNKDISKKLKPKKLKEVNGPKGLEPTRYGDWEKKGRCCDF